MVRRIFRQQTTAFKINPSFGFILRNVETGELRYYHSSQNNAVFFMFQSNDSFVLQNMVWKDDSGTNRVVKQLVDINVTLVSGIGAGIQLERVCV
jgi:hypothetical protein